MKPCPECGSEKVFRYKEYIDAGGGYGPNLLPKLEPNWFSNAKFLPVVCIDCGFTRFFASQDALEKLETSEHWTRA